MGGGLEPLDARLQIGGAFEIETGVHDPVLIAGRHLSGAGSAIIPSVPKSN